ncbi:hypothetical protein TVAG_046620 [Trichomonas vaginalis G3]|uniref:Uncharacterized protein n=1 Tax=Trichomonas vaginalis (strain ATCC PRA-98 / G3) TaxID=412133 RepID=A2EAN7_TRIV3|nr:hypothetical protein TVAGG3_0958340 [Trichomonas vaginalis G3]EAY10240.1 hypothetical protein TVAG_046620 [Trichomonas vaginalis G3]KAI5487722.1 hypothetical protein TVAGG3_0958340 [Trichomonas vaginalis G3]|eukprot:XP_001322463.1 hypothetical protein [Trichomonas vaginalis G3]
MSDVANIKEMLMNISSDSEEYIRELNSIICEPDSFLQQLNNVEDISNKNIAEFVITIQFHIYINTRNTNIEFIDWVLSNQKEELNQDILAYISIIKCNFSDLIQQKNFSLLNRTLEILIANFNRNKDLIIDIINQFYTQIFNNFQNFINENVKNDDLLLIHTQLIKLPFLPQIDDYFNLLASNFNKISDSCSKINKIKFITSLFDCIVKNRLDNIDQNILSNIIKDYISPEEKYDEQVSQVRLVNAAYKVPFAVTIKDVVPYLNSTFISVSQESLISINRYIHHNDKLDQEIFNAVFYRAVEYIDSNLICYDTNEFRFYIQTLKNFLNKQIINLNLYEYEGSQKIVYFSLSAELIRSNENPVLRDIYIIEDDNADVSSMSVNKILLDWCTRYGYDITSDDFRYQHSYFKMINAELKYKQHYFTPKKLKKDFENLLLHYSICNGNEEYTNDEKNIIEFFESKLGNLIYCMASNFISSSIKINISKRLYTDLLEAKANRPDVVKALALLLFANHVDGGNQENSSQEYSEKAEDALETIEKNFPQMLPHFIMKLDPKLIQSTSSKLFEKINNKICGSIWDSEGEIINSDEIWNYIQCLPFSWDNFEKFKELYRNTEIPDCLGPYVTVVVSFVQLYKPFKEPWYEEFILIYMRKRLSFIQSIKYTVKSKQEVKQILEVLSEIYRLMASTNSSHFNIQDDEKNINYYECIKEFLAVLLIKYNDCCEILNYCIKILIEMDDFQLFKYTLSFLFASDFDIFLPKYTNLIKEAVIPYHNLLDDEKLVSYLNLFFDSISYPDFVEIHEDEQTLVRYLYFISKKGEYKPLFKDIGTYTDFCEALTMHRLINPYDLFDLQLDS